MQDLFEENKVLKKALIIASSSLKEVESKLKKLKEENQELKKSVPSYSHMKLNMPLLLENLSTKLVELRKSAVLNKNIKLNLLSEVQELRESHNAKDAELKSLKKKQQLEKKGSYSQISLNKRTLIPASTPKHNRRNNSDPFFFGER